MNRLRNDVFFVETGSYGYCNSLIGLNGIGKTTLIRRLGEEFYERAPENTFYFATVLEDGMTFWSYWTNLLQRFSEEINEEYITSMLPQPTMAQKNAIKKIKSVYCLVNSAPETIETDVYRTQLTRNLDDLFRYYKLIGVRIIITIDEFDRAQTIFSNGQFFQRLFNLTPKGSLTSLNLSIITISRRRVSTIAHHMQEGSNFEDAFPPLPLKGFNDKEIEEYFASYAYLPCGLLPDDMQKQILYLCGRSPGLLMGLRHEFEIMEEPTTDIGWVYAEHGQFIKNAYSRMITLMESTFADRAHHKQLLEVFIQKFIGPAYDDNFDIELPLLYDYGFVTKGTVGSNIYSLTGTQLQQNTKTGNEIVFEPIAPYFVEYIKQTIIPNDLSNLSGLLIKAEKLIREIIESEMKNAYPDTWEELINKYAGKKDYYLETLQVKALQNDFSAGSISKLNVISFKEYYYIIDDYWSLFSKYFSSYSNKNALFTSMALLSDSRNDSAHLNLVVYNGENRRILRETCNFFIQSLEKQIKKAADSYTIPTDEQISILVNNTAQITFCCQMIKMPKKNLRGIIKEYGFPAGIAQKNIDAFAFPCFPKEGDEFTAVIERWDANAQLFNLRAP